MESVSVDEYTHQVINDGLPASLLRAEGRTVAVLALMQRQAGLNRERRRELAAEAKSSATVPHALGVNLPRAEANLLSRFLDFGRRFGAFWHLVGAMRNGKQVEGGLTYATSVEIQLLDAYDPQWSTLALDEDALQVACPEWPCIRQRLEKALDKILRQPPLGLFMLWPRLQRDLTGWSTLDAPTRQTVAHTVFALASVGWTDWFLVQALVRCPALRDELGALLLRPFAHDEREGLPPDPDTLGESLCEAQGDGTPTLPADDAPADADAWDDLLQQLQCLTQELCEQPTREGVAELSVLAERLQGCASALPARSARAIEEFETALQTLLAHGRALCSEPGFDWLYEALVQVEARWRLAVRELTDEAVLRSLAADAQAAAGRCDEAAQALREAQAHLHHCQAEVESLTAALATARGLSERRLLQQRKDEAEGRLRAAGSAVPGLEDELLSALSPYADPFDVGAEYAAQLNGAAAAAMLDTVMSPESVAEVAQIQETTADNEDPRGDVHADSAWKATKPALQEESAAAAGVAALQAAEADASEAGLTLQACANDGAQRALHEDDALQVQDQRAVMDADEIEPVPTTVRHDLLSADDGMQAPPNGAETTFPDDTGVLCRPIWQLLRLNRPALAFHAALWLRELHPQLHTPAPDLLAAVALAGQLLQPDGSVQAALSSRLQLLEPQVFAPDERPAWWTAMNLLLVAATLRPMILASGSGAATVAGYLHLGPRHQALYELVQELRALTPKLMGIRIEPTVLRQARGEAALREDMQLLQHEADDWFKVQAPAVTIKFAAATNVWKHWLKPGGIVSQLVQPVIHNRQDDEARVRALLAQLADADEVERLVHETDRKQVQRRKGEDIHAGALQQLRRRLEEASSLPRKWLTLRELHGSSGDRLREALVELRTRLTQSWPRVERELCAAPENDRWGLVAAAQAVAAQALRAVLALFEPGEAPPPEPLAAQALQIELLEVPALQLGEDDELETHAGEALQAVRQWLDKPLDAHAAFQTRLEQGDLLGAELLGQQGRLGAAEAWQSTWRQEREARRHQLKREIQEVRRVVEIGSAYGYLADADRGRIESALARWEAQLEDVQRFDVALAELRQARDTVLASRQELADQVRKDLARLHVDEHAPDVALVERALGEGDIATANEMVHRLSKGQAAWLEPDEHETDPFPAFFPSTAQALESWLSTQRREQFEQALRSGVGLPGVDVRRMPGAQREQAARMLGAWYDLKAYKQGDHTRLQILFTGLGLTVRQLQRQEQVAGRELWSLEINALEDRHVCPVPLFGSVAGGRYRVVCVWERPTEDDLLQWVGDTAVQRPVLLLYFGRMTERKWRDLSRLSKVKRKSFLLLDETLLAFLCGASGSRLRAWFATSLPFTFSSPYDATAGLVPPEMFYGRGAELDAVLGLNGRCFIYGGRQLGKTALLKRAGQSFHAPQSGHYARWIDLRAEGIGVSRGAEELWVTLGEQLKQMEIVDAKTAAVSTARNHSVEALLRAIRAFLEGDRDRRILLLLDEADRFFELDGRNDFAQTRRLKQLMDETGRRFKVVFAGLHNVLRMTERANHPLAHFGEPIEIGPLREGDEVREAEDLIRRPMAAAGFDFESRSLVIRILAQTNYYPSLIQLYCSHLLRHMLERVSGPQRLNGPRYQVSDHDIERVYSSGALREEIRAKFRLTLQLDPRYEVVAHAIARELLNNRYAHAEGVDWRTVQDWAKGWWAKGFQDTSELDFRVLLDEMVGLGVLSSPAAGRYTLRNPNVLLLLGTQEEIESVLIKDREPAVEFESASFRPPLRNPVAKAQANVFTFQQISELLRRDNCVTVVTGTRCAGVHEVRQSLGDYLNLSGLPVLLDGCSDRASFRAALDEAIERRGAGVTPIVVSDTAPWSRLWLQDARQKLSRLSAGSRFASVIFVADPDMLWGLLNDEAPLPDVPMMSLRPWRDEFLRHWLEEARHLQLDAEDRRRLGKVTGYWPLLLMQTVGECEQVRSLRDRINAARGRLLGDAHAVRQAQSDLGLTVTEPVRVLRDLASLEQPDEPLDAGMLALVTESPRERIELSLHWAELLGLAYREGTGFWRADPIAAALLEGDSA